MEYKLLEIAILTLDTKLILMRNVVKKNLRKKKMKNWK